MYLFFFLFFFWCIVPQSTGGLEVLWFEASLKFSVKENLSADVGDVGDAGDVKVIYFTQTGSSCVDT